MVSVLTEIEMDVFHYTPLRDREKERERLGNVVRSLGKCFLQFYSPQDLFEDEFAEVCISDGREEELEPPWRTEHSEQKPVLLPFYEREHSWHTDVLSQVVFLTLSSSSI